MTKSRSRKFEVRDSRSFFSLPIRRLSIEKVCCFVSNNAPVWNVFLLWITFAPRSFRERCFRFLPGGWRACPLPWIDHNNGYIPESELGLRSSCYEKFIRRWYTGAERYTCHPVQIVRRWRASHGIALCYRCPRNGYTYIHIQVEYVHSTWDDNSGWMFSQFPLLELDGCKILLLKQRLIVFDSTCTFSAHSLVRLLQDHFDTWQRQRGCPCILALPSWFWDCSERREFGLVLQSS